MKTDVTMQDILNLMYENEKKAEQRNKEAEQRNKEAEQRNKEAEQRNKEAEQRREAADQKSEKRREEVEKKQEAADKKRKAEQEAADKKRKAEQEAADKKLRDSIDDLIAVYQKAGLIQGKVAEETIYRSIAPLFEKKGKEFTKVEKNIVVKKDGKKYAEYDVLAINGDEIMPVEVKNNLTTDDVDHFLNTQLPKFRTSFPEYKDYTLTAGIGGLVVSKSAEEYAKKKGLYVFLQNGENVSLANSKDFRAKEFA